MTRKFADWKTKAISNLQSAICNLQFIRPPNFLSVLLIGLVALNYFAPFADLDFAWQVRTGERIVQTGSLQPVEAFSYTIDGQQVPDFEWLYEVILWLVWSGFGFGGLKFLRIVLVAMPLILVVWHLRRQGVRGHGVALAILAAIFILSPAWNLRPLFCTTIGLVLLTCWLHDHCTGPRPLTWWLPVVMLLWANLHPGVIAGQGLLLAAIAWEWLNRRVKLNQPLDKVSLHRLTLIGGAGLLATLIGPDPVARLLYPFKEELRHPIQGIFAEMRPLAAVVATPPYVAILAYGVAFPALSILGGGTPGGAWRIGQPGGPQLARLAATHAGPGCATHGGFAGTGSADRQASSGDWLPPSSGSFLQAPFFQPAVAFSTALADCCVDRLASGFLDPGYSPEHADAKCP